MQVSSLCRRGLALILVAMLAGLLGACAGLNKQLDKQVEAIKPTAKVTGMRLAGISFDKADLVFDVAVENKNPVALKLASLQYDLKLQDQTLVSGSSDRAMELKARGTSHVELPVSLKFADLKKLPGEIWKRDRVQYRLDTRFGIDVPVLGKVEVPARSSGELPVPKLPSFSLKGLSLKKLGFSEAKIVAEVEVDNPNAFDLGMKSLDYRLKVNAQPWGKGQVEQGATVPAKGKGVVAIPVTLDLQSLGRSIYPLLTGKGRLAYELDGNMVLDAGLDMLKDVKLPLKLSGDTSLLR